MRVIITWIKLVKAALREIGWRFKAGNGRIRDHSHPYIKDRNGYGKIQPIGESEGSNNRELMHLQIDSILCADDIVLKNRLTINTSKWRTRVTQPRLGLVLKDGAEAFQAYPICFVEVEILVAESDKEFVFADGFRSLG